VSIYFVGSFAIVESHGLRRVLRDVATSLGKYAKESSKHYRRDEQEILEDVFMRHTVRCKIQHPKSCQTIQRVQADLDVVGSLRREIGRATNEDIAATHERV